MRSTSLTISLLLLQLLFITKAIHAQDERRFVISEDFTPVLNTADYRSVFGGANGNRVKVDKKGLIREMEFIAFPGTIFEVVNSVPQDGYEILEVKTNDYVYDAILFIDSRFVREYESGVPPADRKKSLPSKDEIILGLKELEGYPYMWGGNFADGVVKMLEYYQPSGQLEEQEIDLWTMKGVDCSGLIYQVTGGFTPRNTSSLVDFGTGLEIQGMSAEEIVQLIEPLDLIVWKGHVIIVLDNSEVIESRPNAGVVRSSLVGRLKEVMKERTPVSYWGSSGGDKFVVRRWVDLDNP